MTVVDKNLTKDSISPLHKSGDKDMKSFIKLAGDKRGASAAEYALILAIIGAVIAIAALGLADAIGNAMNDTADCIDNPVSSNPNC